MAKGSSPIIDAQQSIFDKSSYNNTDSKKKENSSPLRVTQNSGITVAKGDDQSNMVAFDPIEPAIFDHMFLKPEEIAMMVLNE